MSKTQFIKTLLLIWGAIMITATGYAAWKISIDIEEVTSGIIQPTNIPAASKDAQTTVPEIDTSDWEVYKNEVYGYTIKYADDWVVRDNGYITTKSFTERETQGYEIQSLDKPLDYLQYDAQVKIKFFKNPMDSFREYIEAVGCIEKENIIISNIESMLCKTFPEGFTFYTVYIPIPSDQNLVSIQARSNERKYSPERLASTFRLMLSTFELTSAP
jgi:hypothetical protein